MKFRFTLFVVLVILLIFIIVKVPLYYYIIPVFSGLIFLFFGVKNIQWNYFFIAYHKLENSKREVALTFDDGPHPEFTPQVLDFLKENHIQATFFCIGKQAEQYPELVKRIYEEGHVLGNHSFTHSHLIDFNSSKRWVEEIRKADHTLVAVTGKKVLYFRPPFGVTTPHLARALKKTGHITIGWSVRPYDTQKQSAQQLIQKIKYKTRPGDIVLLHDTHSRILPVLKKVIPYFKTKKYTFVTINQGGN